jgi:hypothetical protein
MKKIIKPILIASGIMLFTSCGESPSVKKLVDLRPEEKQAVIAISVKFNTLLRQKATLNFLKTAMLQSDKASFMMDYLSPSFNSEQKEMALKIVSHLFPKPSQDLKSRTAEDNFFNVSPPVAQLTKKLTDELKNVMVKAHNDALTTDQLTASLNSVIVNFKTEVQENTSLAFDESGALMAFAEFENNSIGELVNMASALNTNSGGRTQGWFDDLVSIVVTAVVAAVVVVAVVVTLGAAAIAVSAAAAASASAWFATAVELGAILGGAYGAIIGYSQAVDHNMYWYDFNISNIGGAFLDWDHCYNDPGNWQCI